MKIVFFSTPLKQISTQNPDPVILFMQFYVDLVRPRHHEIQECLRKNVENPHISQIILLNERIYSETELGISSPKIVQIKIGKRLQYCDFFSHIRENNVQGYCVLANSDIFLDESIARLKTSDLHQTPTMLALLRYEYNGRDTENSSIFGPRYDSQDTWIIHSSQNIRVEQERIFKFRLGTPGCDNKMVYLMNMLNYKVVNDPQTIRTYHNHRSNIRNYTPKDALPKPWGVLVPYGYSKNRLQNALGLNIQTLDELRYSDHRVLYEYVKQKIDANKPFVIPRISTIETEFAVMGRVVKHTTNAEMIQNIVDHLQGRPNQILKNNAGIKITNRHSLVKYSDMYLKAFEDCDIYGGWDKQGHVYPCVADSQDFIENKVCQTKRMIWGFAFDIFHYIYDPLPWTHALRGKRILIVSAFEETVKEKIPIREKIYGIDLFPECSFVVLKPPQTQGNEPSQEFDIELTNFFRKLDEIEGTYDVALVACGGYGALVVSNIYSRGHPAIYVGGVLQMYFGILGNRWLKERPDVVRLFLNEHWSRPKQTEKPSNCETIEGSCYW